MRICPVCQRPPRAHDPLYRVENYDYSAAAEKASVQYVGAGVFPIGSYCVCYDCFKERNPDTEIVLRVPPPRNFEVVVGSSSLNYQGRFFCSICKTYAREDDPIAEMNTCIRLEPEDVVDTLAEPYAALEYGDEAFEWTIEQKRDAYFRDHPLLADIVAGHRTTHTDIDVSKALKAAGGTEMGLRICCLECFGKYAPAVARRWARAKIIPEGTPYQALGYNLS